MGSWGCGARPSWECHTRPSSPTHEPAPFPAAAAAASSLQTKKQRRLRLVESAARKGDARMRRVKRTRGSGDGGRGSGRRGGDPGTPWMESELGSWECTKGGGLEALGIRLLVPFVDLGVGLKIPD
jgi:hypothetical protein